MDKAGVPAARIAVGYDVGPNGAPAPAVEWRVGASAGAGGIYSSVRDMARYLAFHLAAYPPRSGPDTGPVRRASVRESHATGFRSGLFVEMEPAPKKGESLVNAEASTYGFGWGAGQSCDFDLLVGHSGGMPGFTADVKLLPDRGVAVVALAGASQGDPGAITRKALRILRQGGGLSKRSLAVSPALEAAMRKLLAVYNAWDDAGYAAMQTAGRKAAGEKEELAGYKALHGACKGFAPVEAMSSVAARFALDCERGAFEMELAIDPTDGLVAGSVGTTPDAPIPAALKKVADRIAGLVKRWDAAVFAKTLAGAKKTKEETAATFADLRAAHGACTVRSLRRKGFDRSFTLDCERGGDLALTMEIDPKDAGAVVRYAIRAEGEGGCPVR